MGFGRVAYRKCAVGALGTGYGRSGSDRGADLGHRNWHDPE